MSKDSTVCFTTRNPGHNNVRYSVLFPRLAPYVKFKTFAFSKFKPLRGLQSRFWRRYRDTLIYPRVLAALSKSYATLYTVEISQLPFWSKPVVIDVDDTAYRANDVRLLNQAQVKALVVTSDRAKTIFAERGVQAPIHVIPQGVPLEHINPARVEEIRTQYKRESLVVGYMAPRLTLQADGPKRPRRGRDDIDGLYQMVAHARGADPRLQLWLIGHASPALQALAGEQDWVRLFGYIPMEQLLNYVENFDIGAYPRAAFLPEGRFNVKTAQYMACGVPIVSTNVVEAEIVRETGSGIIADTAEDFTQALMRLAQDADLRHTLGGAGKQYALEHLNWNILVTQYAKILS